VNCLIDELIFKMETYTIDYCGTSYPVVDVTIFEGTSNEMNVTVSNTDLEEKLMYDMENGIGADEAYRLDETIGFYIRPEEMSLPYEQIVEIVEESYN
jgi:hypothetical protein